MTLTQDDLRAATAAGLRELAEITDGYVGSDLASIAREAAMTALRRAAEVGVSWRAGVRTAKIPLLDWASCRFILRPFQ